MRVYHGTVYKNNLEPIDGYVITKNGYIDEVGEGKPPTPPDITGTIIPSFINAHSHLGDSSLKVDPDKYSLRELVGPGGIKEKGLERLSQKELIAGMKRSLKKGISEGTTHYLDYREGGLEGIKALKKASETTKAKTKIYGRPTEITKKNIKQVVEYGDGVGLSSVCDYTPKELEILKKELTEPKKTSIGLHAGESKTNQKKSIERYGRSEIQRSLDFKPNHLVHLTNPLQDDIKTVYNNQVGIVVCPRSNEITKSGKPPIKKMIEKGLLVGLGTDNAMLCSPSILDEARYLYQKHDLNPKTVLKLSTINGGKIIGVDNRIIQGNRTNIMVIEEVNMGIKALLEGCASIATVISGLDVIENV
ncbi:amidohydrolase family protein [Methanonatronarchaeum sp. AMET-Sl]|uniref:amidohydrolase family protein n=1 Tax=Methanonatronarchaeum sp. AMET-Sl TaxID=3037654 RepID=UPI00244D9E47|nr:amidohydrolase family protein [Methanonatronarchaeum sp. AMET-Sl]WGI17737.1 amidohydrolase family protein [Methanonatronarchaeum sp. AMET-Sl]